MVPYSIDLGTFDQKKGDIGMKRFLVCLFVLSLFLTACKMPSQTVSKEKVPTETPRPLVEMTIEASRGELVKLGGPVEVKITFRNKSNSKAIFRWNMSQDGLFRTGSSDQTFIGQEMSVSQLLFTAEKVGDYYFVVIATGNCDFVGGNTRSLLINVIE